MYLIELKVIEFSEIRSINFKVTEFSVCRFFSLKKQATDRAIDGCDFNI